MAEKQKVLLYLRAALSYLHFGGFLPSSLLSSQAISLQVFSPVISLVILLPNLRPSFHPF